MSGIHVQNKTSATLGAMVTKPHCVGQLHPIIQQRIMDHPDLMLKRLDRPDFQKLSFLVPVHHGEPLSEYLKVVSCQKKGKDITPENIGLDPSLGSVMYEMKMIFRSTGDCEVNEKLRVEIGEKVRSIDACHDRKGWVPADPIDMLAFVRYDPRFVEAFPLMAIGPNVPMKNEGGVLSAIRIDHVSGKGNRVMWARQASEHKAHYYHPYVILAKRPVTIS